jgi:response regulator RpfG family c-di-GMP phosphodiesterase
VHYIEASLKDKRLTVSEKTETGGNKLRILVVDDELDLLQMLKISLSAKYEVVTAINGLDALRKLDLSEADFVICDINMPVMDGFQTVEAIRRHPKFHDIPVFFLTAIADKERVRQTYAVGGNLYLHKPFDPTRLMAAIATYVDEFQLMPRPKRYTLAEVERLSTTDALASELAAGVEARDFASAALSPDKLRILAVDNNHLHLDWYAHVLSPYCDFIPCNDAIAAMEKIVRYTPDIMILNPQLEHLTGLQLYRFIKGLCPITVFEVIFCSDVHSVQLSAEVTQLTHNPLLIFPLKQQQLLGTIKTILQKPSFRLKKKKSSLDTLKIEETQAEQQRKEAERKMREQMALRKRYESLQRFIDEEFGAES